MQENSQLCQECRTEKPKQFLYNTKCKYENQVT